MELYKNKEIKNFTIKFFIAAVLFLTLSLIIMKVNIENINKKYIEQNIGIIGAIVKSNPNLEEEIVGNFTRGYKNNYAYGKEILKKYNYDEKENAKYSLIFGDIYKKYLIISISIIGIFIMIFYIIAMLDFKMIFLKIRNFAEGAEKIVEGNFTYIFQDNLEGDIYILGHQFNAMSYRLKESIEKLKEEKIALKDVIADITHQLKTPLSSLIIFNDLMLKDLDMDMPQRKEFLSLSKVQFDRIDWLIKNLLKMMRFEAKVVEFYYEEAPIEITINKAIEGLKTLAYENNVSINMKGNGEGIINHDINWTAEAISNIIKNSIEHSNSGGRVKITYEETPLSLQIIVEDNGTGIDEKELPNIFKRFYKGKNSINPISIGIGLYISKSIIEGQSGTITVSSKLGEGTKFEITFLKTII